MYITNFMQGPDFVWHMDGYDKLKPFGFCIHECIDGLVYYVNVTVHVWCESEK